ncbi:endonuclease [Leptospira ryugenii]|nr:endonuclease [Leptospira ryugenii]
MKQTILCLGLISISVLFALSNLPSETEAEGTKSFQIDDFNKAKKFLRRIYRKGGYDFYCSCPFQVSSSLEGRFEIQREQCALESRTGNERSKYIEWEHIVPAHAFGKHRSCWTDDSCYVQGKKVKGRKCCQGTDPEFREIEADLHNLVPAPGELNQDRGNFDFGIIPGEPRQYGACDFEVNFSEAVAEPREAIRGDIARIYFYMEKQWGVEIQKSKRTLYEKWNQEDPVDTFEIQKNEAVEKVQGRKNPFIP